VYRLLLEEMRLGRSRHATRPRRGE
jgi:hypothetical protein